MSRPQVVVPNISMSGTHPSELLAQYFLWLQSLHEAHQAVLQCAPNGRDYFQEAGKMKAACVQHSRWREWVEEMIQDATAVISGIQEQSP